MIKAPGNTARERAVITTRTDPRTLPMSSLAAGYTLTAGSRGTLAESLDSKPEGQDVGR